jgi:uncharacterized membrane protein
MAKSIKFTNYKKKLLLIIILNQYSNNFTSKIWYCYSPILIEKCYEEKAGMILTQTRITRYIGLICFHETTFLVNLWKVNKKNEL